MEIRTEVVRRQGKKWNETAELLYKLQQKRKEIQKKEAFLIDKLKEISGYGAAMGKSFLFSVSINKGRIDYSNIPALKGIDLEPFRKKPVALWKLQKLN